MITTIIFLVLFCMLLTPLWPVAVILYIVLALANAS
jgi:hypothetical protein